MEHSPPIANTTHFIIEYQAPLVVAVNGGTRTATTVGDGLANLYDISFNKTKSKMTKMLIGVYGQLPPKQFHNIGFLRVKQ